MNQEDLGLKSLCQSDSRRWFGVKRRNKRLDLESGKFDLFIFARNRVADDITEHAAEQDIACPVVAGIHHTITYKTGGQVCGYSDFWAVKFMKNRSDTKGTRCVAAWPGPVFAIGSMVF